MTLTAIQTHPVLRADGTPPTEALLTLLGAFLEVVQCFGCGNDAHALSHVIRRAQDVDTALVFICDHCAPLTVEAALYGPPTPQVIKRWAEDNG